MKKAIFSKEYRLPVESEGFEPNGSKPLPVRIL